MLGQLRTSVGAPLGKAAAASRAISESLMYVCVLTQDKRKDAARCRRSPRIDSGRGGTPSIKIVAAAFIRTPP